MSYGAEVPFLRPKVLAEDTSTSADAIIHAINWLREINEEFEITLEAMATNPLKTVVHIDECLEMMEDKQVPYVVAVNQIFDQHPSRVKFLEDGIMRDFYPEILESRRQDLTPNAFIRSGSIYCMNTDILLKTKARYGKDNSAAYILQAGDVINIDEVNDLLMAETILKER
jgi:CMP-N-acetylneuraminic acid synthetase